MIYSLHIGVIEAILSEIIGAILMTPVILMIMKTVVIYRVSCNYTEKLLGMVWDIKIFILYVKNVSINFN